MNRETIVPAHFYFIHVIEYVPTITAMSSHTLILHGRRSTFEHIQKSAHRVQK
jgi:hypothetical protein